MLETEWWKVCGEAWVQEQRKMSHVLGAIGLLDLAMLTACSGLARVLKLMNRLTFQILAVGLGKPRTTETTDTESVDMGACL